MKRVAECLYQNESSKTYFALVKKNGQQTKRSLKTQDRKLAERRLREFREQMAELSTEPGDRRLKFSSLSERWLTISNAGLKPSSQRRNQLIVSGLSNCFRDKLVANINRIDCENWAAKRIETVSSRTFNYDLQVLKRIMRYAVDTGIMLRSPADSLKPRKDPPKAILVPTRSQFDKLIQTLEDMTSLDARSRHAIELVKLLAYSGMRLGEATRIIWSEIDLDQGTFTVSGGDVGTKNGEVRIIPLFPGLRHFLEGLLSKRLIINTTDKVVFTKTARTAIESACRKSGLPKFDHHCLRHFFASNAIENGVDFKTIAAWLGHKDGGLLVSKRYGHLRDTHSHEMAKLMV